MAKALALLVALLVSSVAHAAPLLPAEDASGRPVWQAWVRTPGFNKILPLTSERDVVYQSKRLSCIAFMGAVGDDGSISFFIECVYDDGKTNFAVSTKGTCSYGGGETAYFNMRAPGGFSRALAVSCLEPGSRRS